MRTYSTLLAETIKANPVSSDGATGSRFHFPQIYLSGVYQLLEGSFALSCHEMLEEAIAALVSNII